MFFEKLYSLTFFFIKIINISYRQQEWHWVWGAFLYDTISPLRSNVNPDDRRRNIGRPFLHKHRFDLECLSKQFLATCWKMWLKRFPILGSYRTPSLYWDIRLDPKQSLIKIDKDSSFIQINDLSGHLISPCTLERPIIVDFNFPFC